MTLLELADACERAKGEDRELDIAIKVAVGHPWDYSADWGVHGVVALPYTASLDAAMQLVPEVDWEPYGGAVSAYNVVITTAYNSVGVYPTDGASTGMHDKRGGRAVARSVPLAICAAALRARHAMESQ